MGMKFILKDNWIIWSNFMKSISDSHKYTHFTMVNQELEKFNGKYTIRSDNFGDNFGDSYILFNTLEDMTYFTLRFYE
jgi:hypothetical protein